MNKMINKIFHKYENMNLPAKAAIWFTFCNVMQKGISMITVPIFTRILSTEEYGIFSIYLSWMNIIVIFTSLNLYYGVFNNAMLKYEDERNKFTSSMQGLTVVITSFFFAIYLLGKDFFNNIIGLSTIFMVLMFIEMAVTPALQFWSVRQRFEFKYKALVGITLAKSLLNPILGIVAVLVTRRGDLARVFSMVMLEVLFCGTIMIYQFIKGKSFFVKEYWKYAILFNLPLLPHYLSGSILNQGDRVMINMFSGKTEVGIYSVAYNIGMLMQLFTNAINASFTPWFYMSLKEKKYEEIKRVTNLLLLLMSILVILLMFFSPEVIKIFATKDYYEAVYVIPPISASVFFVFMYVLFSNLEFYFEENKFIMIGSVSAAILNVALNYFFIPRIGYLVAGYTTLVSYVLYCLAHYIFSLGVCKKHINSAKLYNGKFIFILSLGVIIATLLFNILYNYTILRYLLALIFGIILCIKRDYFKRILMLIKSK